MPKANVKSSSVGKVRPNRKPARSRRHSAASARPVESHALAGLEPLWSALSDAVAGEGHAGRGLPCQDRAAAWIKPRPGVAVLDGRGSASRSHEGAAAALESIRGWIEENDAAISSCLDSDVSQLARVSWMSLACALYVRAARCQGALAERSGVSAKEYEFTMTVAILGKTHLGWLAVGDSPLVLLKNGLLGQPHETEAHEFANQTRFVQSCPSGAIGLRCGVVSAEGIEAVVAMSDGTASRLIDLRRQTPAEANRQLAILLASGKLGPAELRNLLLSPDWLTATRDDRSIAIIASGSLAGSQPRKRGPDAEDAVETAETADFPGKALPVFGPIESAAACLAAGFLLALLAAPTRGGSGETSHPQPVRQPPVILSETRLRLRRNTSGDREEASVTADAGDRARHP